MCGDRQEQTTHVSITGLPCVCVHVTPIWCCCEWVLSPTLCTGPGNVGADLYGTTHFTD